MTDSPGMEELLSQDTVYKGKGCIKYPSNYTGNTLENNVFKFFFENPNKKADGRGGRSSPSKPIWFQKRQTNNTTREEPNI
jgi:hypothetical protein